MGETALRGMTKEFEMRQAKDYIVFPLDVSSAEEAKSYVDLLADNLRF